MSHDQSTRWLLLGVRRRARRFACGTLAVVVLAICLGAVVPRTLLSGRTGGLLVWLFDGYLAGVLFMTMAVVTVGGLVYGAYNGGPVLAAALPIVPVLTGNLLTGQLTITVDLTLALCSATAAAVVATNRSRDLSPAPSPLAVGVGVSFGSFLIGCVVFWRLFNGPAVNSLGIALCLGFLLIAGFGLLYQLLWLLDIDGSTTKRS